MRLWFTMKMLEAVVDPDDDLNPTNKKKNGDEGENGDGPDDEGEDDEENDDGEKTKKKSYVEIAIYDEIGKSFWGDDTVTAKDFVANLAEMGEDFESIELHINSPGGDVFDGVAIHNALKNHKAKVTAHIDGIAASIASYIAMAADEIIMPANAFMLLHNASGFAMGTAEDLRATAADLERIDKSITATYAKRSGQTPAKMRSLMKEDRLMDAKEAKEWGLADTMAREVEMAANFSLRLLPEKAAKQFSAEIGESPRLTPAPKAEAEVVTLKAARRQGMTEHKAYVEGVTDLCTLAGMPEKVGDYIRNETPIKQVRKELLEARAAAPQIMPHNPLLQQKSMQATMTAWDKVISKLNARVNPKGT